MKYTKDDCIKDTTAHINAVRKNINDVNNELFDRGYLHDGSKLESPELELFTEFTPKLKSLTYGSDEYKESIKGLGVALKHHYANNSHHPEHYENGINGMSLLDVIEMLCDWKAATQRHDDGNLLKSLEINKERFGISDQLYQILINTIEEMGWIE